MSLEGNDDSLMEEEERKNEASLMEEEDKKNEASIMKEEERKNEASLMEEEDKRNEASLMEEEDKRKEASLIEEEEQRNEVSLVEEEERRNQASLMEEEERRNEARAMEEEERWSEAGPMEEDERRPLITAAVCCIDGMCHVCQAKKGYSETRDGASSLVEVSEHSENSGTQSDTALTIREIGKHSTTDTETLIHFLKCNVGTGILAMPEAFMNSGLWVGLAGIPIMGLICVHCMFRLVQCSRELCKRRKVPTLSYEETVRAAFELGPDYTKKFANCSAFLIKFALCVTQFGFGCVYFVFIAQNMKQAVDSIMITGTGISNLGFMGMAVLPVLFACFVPSLKCLAPFSLIAGLAQVTGLMIILYYSVRDLPKVTEHVPAFNSWGTLPLYFASAIYAFEGIGLVLPLESQMKDPSHLLGYSGVLATATFFVICLYAAIGFYGYQYYGNSVLGSISLNLPPNERMAQAVKITMSIAIYLTYPLQIYVVFEMLKPYIHRKFSTNISRNVADYSSRTIIVLSTFGLAAAVPNIGLFISMVGAFSSSALSLIFPPIIDILTFWDDKGRYYWKFVKNMLIFVFGILEFLIGTATSIKVAILYYNGGDHDVHKFMMGSSYKTQ